MCHICHSLVFFYILVFVVSILSLMLCLSLKKSMVKEEMVNVILNNVATVGENTLMYKFVLKISN